MECQTVVNAGNWRVQPHSLVPKTHNCEFSIPALWGNLGTVSMDYSNSKKILTFLKSVILSTVPLLIICCLYTGGTLSPFTMVPTASFEYSVVASALKLEA